MSCHVSLVCGCWTDQGSGEWLHVVKSLSREIPSTGRLTANLITTSATVRKTLPQNWWEQSMLSSILNAFRMHLHCFFWVPRKKREKINLCEISCFRNRWNNILTICCCTQHIMINVVRSINSCHSLSLFPYLVHENTWLWRTTLIPEASKMC